MTSDISLPRRLLTLCSPSTHLIASTTFDLPEPFGPTTTVIPAGNSNRVLSAKLLKPTSSSAFNMGSGLRELVQRSGKAEGRRMKAEETHLSAFCLRPSAFLLRRDLCKQVRHRRGHLDDARAAAGAVGLARVQVPVGVGERVDLQAATQRAGGLRLLQELDDVGIASAEFDNRASH